MSHLAEYVTEMIIDSATNPVVESETSSTTEVLDGLMAPSPITEVAPTSPTEPAIDQVGGPMLIRIMSPTCRHCDILNERWATVEAAFRNVIPNLRTQEIMVRQVIDGYIIDAIYPQGLNSYITWFPMLLLINSTLWDQAVAAQAAGETLPLRDGVLIWGGQWVNGVLTHVGGYDHVAWVRALGPEQLGALTGPVRPIPPVEYVRPGPPHGSMFRTGPLDQLVSHQSLVQSTYDVMGQIRGLRPGPLRNFLAQSVIMEATDLIEPTQNWLGPVTPNRWCILL